MEKRNDLHIIMVNPSEASVASVPDSLKPVTWTASGNNMAEAFYGALSSGHISKYNLLIDGRFGIYNAENIERSIKTMESGPYKYGIYGMAITDEYWTPQVSIDRGVFDKVFINSPFLIRNDIIGNINFSNIKNMHVYHSLLAQIQRFIGADFCYPGIKICQNPLETSNR